MNNQNRDCLAQIDELLALRNQSWLFGAGISVNAGVPLMYPLTERVLSLAIDNLDKPDMKILTALQTQLPDAAHIEHILSQLCDYNAIAHRSKDKSVQVGESSLDIETMDRIHNFLLRHISETIRWGYFKGNGGKEDRIGTSDKPVVSIDIHKAFVSALFERSQAGVAERRTPVKLFTTNYDTLMEDALALGRIQYWDGFDGGAVAFKSFRYGDTDPAGAYRAHIIKLHGSIDWHHCEDDQVWRVREKDVYPSKAARVLIYPQSTKYVATQRDPFSAQFDQFRRTLGSGGENLLSICGYSFGDEHINQEIELALSSPNNKTTVLAFSSALTPLISELMKKPFGKRIYAITKAGVYVGGEGPFVPPPAELEHDWWTFEGVTKVLTNGMEACSQ